MVRYLFFIVVGLFSGSLFSQQLQFIEVWKKTNFVLKATIDDVYTGQRLRTSKRSAQKKTIGLASVWVLDDLENNVKHGYIETLTVDRSFQGNGVGRYLFCQLISFLYRDPSITETEWLAFPMGLSSGSSECKKNLLRLKKFYLALGGIPYVANYYSESRDAKKGIDFFLDRAGMQALASEARQDHDVYQCLEDKSFNQTCFGSKIVLNTTATRRKDVCLIRYKTAAHSKKINELTAIQFLDSRVSAYEVACLISRQTGLSLDYVRAAILNALPRSQTIPGLYDFAYEVSVENF